MTSSVTSRSHVTLWRHKWRHSWWRTMLTVFATSRSHIKIVSATFPYLCLYTFHPNPASLPYGVHNVPIWRQCIRDVIYDVKKLYDAMTYPDVSGMYIMLIRSCILLCILNIHIHIHIHMTLWRSLAYPDVTFTINMSRRSLFYVVNLIFPCLLIYAVSFLGFFLPSESGDKINLEITVLLALVVFLLIAGETLPPTPDSLPALGQL